MAVTGDRRRRTLFDEDQECYRTSSGNRERRFGRGCVQTSAAVDGGRSIPPTPLFSGPSDGEREYQRWNAHRRIRSPPPSHRYLRHHSPPSPSSSSSQHPIHIYHHQPSSPSINSSTHSRRPNQSQKHHTRETHKPQFHRFENTHENQFETTKTHSRFSHHNSVTKYKPPNHRFTHTHEIQIDSPHNHYTQSRFAMTHENQTEITKTHTHFSHETYCGTSLGAWSDTATNRKLKHLNSINLHFDPTMSNESLSNSQFIGKAKEINVVKDIHNRGMNNVQSKMEGTIKGFSDGKAEMISKIEMLDEVMVGECAESRNANESLDLFDRSPLDTIACDSVHFAEPMNDYCAGKNYKTVPKHKPTLPKGRPTTLIDMMQFVSDWFDFEENENTSCDVLGDIIVDCGNSVQECVELEESDDQFESSIFDSCVVSEGRVANCGNNAQEKLVDCFDVVKYEEGNNKIEQLISENFTQQMVEEIDLEVVNEVHVDPTNLVVEEIGKTIESNIFEGSVLMSHVLIGQIVSTLGFGFENVKTKGVRRCQWQIAWSFPAFRWTIVLVPLWISDELRRDFSVGVYHSYKPNRGLRSIVVLLVLLPRASTELEVEFFSKKG